MPRSILLGRPWPAAGEPLWTAEDFDLAAQWQAELDAACPGCGHPAEEAWDRANLHAYEAEVRRCWACTTRARKTKTLDADTRDGQYVVTHFDPRPRE